jgi:RNA polymerase-binding transcription factor DksA
MADGASCSCCATRDEDRENMRRSAGAYAATRIVMTITTKTRVRQRLLARRRELLERYQTTLALAEDAQVREIELVDAANDQWDLRVLSTMSDADAFALEAVIAALQRLEAGTYGACTECGARIEAQRLAVLPEAGLCFDCADFAEQRLPRWAAGSVAE